MTFKLLVLRFMSFMLRAKYLGGFSTEEAQSLHDDVEGHMARAHDWPFPGRTLPAGIETKHGQAAIDVEENGD